MQKYNFVKFCAAPFVLLWHFLDKSNNDDADASLLATFFLTPDEVSPAFSKCLGRIEFNLIATACIVVDQRDEAQSFLDTNPFQIVDHFLKFRC